MPAHRRWALLAEPVHGASERSPDPNGPDSLFEIQTFPLLPEKRTEVSHLAMFETYQPSKLV